MRFLLAFSESFTSALVKTDPRLIFMVIVILSIIEIILMTRNIPRQPVGKELRPFDREKDLPSTEFRWSLRDLGKTPY